MEWVLMMFLFTGNGGVRVDSQEFKTEKACIVAKDWVIKNQSTFNTPRAICVNRYTGDSK